MVAEAHRSALLCIKIGFRFLALSLSLPPSPRPLYLFLCYCFDSSLVANKRRTHFHGMENGVRYTSADAPPNRHTRTHRTLYGIQSSHENLNQFSAQRVEKHSFNFNLKLSRNSTTRASSDRQYVVRMCPVAAPQPNCKLTVYGRV